MTLEDQVLWLMGQAALRGPDPVTDEQLLAIQTRAPFHGSMELVGRCAILTTDILRDANTSRDETSEWSPGMVAAFTDVGNGLQVDVEGLRALVTVSGDPFGWSARLLSLGAGIYVRNGGEIAAPLLHNDPSPPSPPSDMRSKVAPTPPPPRNVDPLSVVRSGFDTMRHAGVMVGSDARLAEIIGLDGGQASRIVDSHPPAADGGTYLLVTDVSVTAFATRTLRPYKIEWHAKASEILSAVAAQNQLRWGDTPSTCVQIELLGGASHVFYLRYGRQPSALEPDRASTDGYLPAAHRIAGNINSLRRS